MFFPLRDDNPRSRFPALTVAIIVANAAVWLYELSMGDQFLAQFFFQAGAIPARFTGVAVVAVPDAYPAAATLVSSMFMHGGWMHILSNMWFLWVFGDNVEEFFGPLVFLLFYLLTGLAATATHIVFEAGSTVPVVGASGAVSGVLGAYAVLFPRARVYTYIWIIIIIRTFHLPAWIFLGLWIGMQFFSLGDSGVAWWAHIGGFAAGALIALATLAGGKRPQPPRFAY